MRGKRGGTPPPYPSFFHLRYPSPVPCFTLTTQAILRAHYPISYGYLALMSFISLVISFRFILRTPREKSCVW